MSRQGQEDGMEECEAQRKRLKQVKAWQQGNTSAARRVQLDVADFVGIELLGSSTHSACSTPASS